MPIISRDANSTLVYLVVLSISIIFLVFSQVTEFVNDSMKFVGRIVVYPFYLVSKGVSYSIDSLSRNFRYFIDTKTRLEKLEEEVKLLSQKLALYQVYYAENNYLKNLVSIRDTIKYSTQIAKVINFSIDNVSEEIVIDKGLLDGITKKMPVVAYWNGSIGLVGIIQEVSLNTSVVRTVYSPNIDVGVVLENTGEVGILSGKGRVNKSCKVRYISSYINVDVGKEKVFTFSGSKIFPPGILVGTVSSMLHKPGDKYSEVEVIPHIDIKNISHVIVITAK